MKTLLILIIGAAVVIGGYYWLSGEEDSAAPSPSPTVSVSPTVTSSPAVSPTPTATTTKTPTPGAQVKSFTVTGNTNFRFSLNEMRVKKGDTVKITFRNLGGNHDWKIDEFGAGTKVLAAGQEETIQFVANKTGSFEYYCSVGTHRQLGMKGTLIVE